MQFAAVDAVRKARPVTRCITVRCEAFKFRDRSISHNVVGIEREDPWCFDLSFAQSKLPLIAMRIKRALKDAHLGKRSSNLQRLVIAKTIHHHDVARPTQTFEGPANIRRLVIREY